MLSLLILKDLHIGQVNWEMSTFWILEFNFQQIKVLKEQRQIGKLNASNYVFHLEYQLLYT